MKTQKLIWLYRIRTSRWSSTYNSLLRWIENELWIQSLIKVCNQFQRITYSYVNQRNLNFNHTHKDFMFRMVFHYFIVFIEIQMNINCRLLRIFLIVMIAANYVSYVLKQWCCHWLPFVIFKQHTVDVAYRYSCWCHFALRWFMILHISAKNSKERSKVGRVRLYNTLLHNA